jgi:hypothetical protein
MTPFIQSIIRSLVKADIDPTEMHWFDISGVLDQVTVDQNWLHEYRPPFEKCMVVWRGQSETHETYEFTMVVMGTDPEEGITLSVHKGPYGQKYQKLPLMVYVLDEGMIHYGPVDENEVIDQKAANVILGVVGKWYEMLAQGCSSHKPSVRQTFTNRRKISEGKMPTYDWTTVYIDAPAKRSESKGGTHASPRLHDRRGHLRRLKNGKNVWVKSCKVGDASKGAVWHDYTVKAATCTS